MKNRICNLLSLPDPAGLHLQRIVKTCKVWKTLQVALLFVCALIISCQQNYTPKPHAYYRIDFPEREYRTCDSIGMFTFEYPVYGTLTHVTRPSPDSCWLNIKFPRYRGTIYLTYHKIDNNFDWFIEDNQKIIYTKIAQKADAVDLYDYGNPESKVYGTIYDIRGNAASQVQFYATDSVRHFLRGSLYFYTKPNYDSLAPVIAFFREDITHLIKSIRWKETNVKNKNGIINQQGN